MYYQIKGFKGLKNTTKLDLAPITILVGKNGSGKSSAISALNKIKDISSIGNRFNNNKMESFLNFSLPNRRDFGVDIDGELDYVTPINLSFFDDKFELRMKYGANSDLIYLTRFEIFNVTQNEFLFCLNGENVLKENDLGIEVEALKLSLRINLDYLLNEFKRLKKLYPKPFNLLDFVAKK
jgi:AAA15 family ATPase/GTPase